VGISNASIQEITCEDCERSFESDVWIVIDVVERPDLLSMCRDKARIRAFLCPNCHHYKFEYFPLMLLYTSADRVVFIINRDWPDEDNRDAAEKLAIWISTGIRPMGTAPELKKMVARYLENAVVLDQMDLMLGRVPEA
jgi:hypothetical protein